MTNEEKNLLIQVGLLLVTTVPLFSAVAVKAVRKVKTMKGFLQELRGLPDMIRDLRKQLEPDSGNTFHDKVMSEITGVKARLDEHYTFMTGQRQIVLALADRRGHQVWFIADKQGLFVDTSQGFNVLTGRADHHGNNWIVSVAEHDRDRILKRWQDSIRLETDFDERYQIVREGVLTKVRTEAYPIRHPNGTVHHWFGIVHVRQGTSVEIEHAPGDPQASSR